jgi:hypothetical protein
MGDAGDTSTESCEGAMGFMVMEGNGGSLRELPGMRIDCVSSLEGEWAAEEVTAQRGKTFVEQRLRNYFFQGRLTNGLIGNLRRGSDRFTYGAFSDGENCKNDGTQRPEDEATYAPILACKWFISKFKKSNFYPRI